MKNKLPIDDDIVKEISSLISQYQDNIERANNEHKKTMKKVTKKLQEEMKKKLIERLGKKFKK
jgi:t-SNARE complex subunit (syntaxin)